MSMNVPLHTHAIEHRITGTGLIEADMASATGHYTK